LDVQYLGRLGSHRSVHGTRESFKRPAVSEVHALRCPDFSSRPQRSNLRLIAMPDRVPEVDENVESLEISIGIHTLTPENLDEHEPEPAEVASQHADARSLTVEFPSLGKQDAKELGLALVGMGYVDVDSSIVKIATEGLELGDQGDEEASVQLFGTPSAPWSCACGLGVDLLQLVQPRQTSGSPLSQRCRRHWHLSIKTSVER
jgi:hypothetical protein